MKAKAALPYGRITDIDAVVFKEEVTNVKDVAVVVHMYKPGLEVSEFLHELLVKVAAKHRGTKFVRIQYRNCIPNYPEGCDRGRGRLVVTLRQQPADGAGLPQWPNRAADRGAA